MCLLLGSETILLVVKAVSGTIVLAMVLAGVGFLAWRRRSQGERHVAGSEGLQIITPTASQALFSASTTLLSFRNELGHTLRSQEEYLSHHIGNTRVDNACKGSVLFHRWCLNQQSRTTFVQMNCPPKNWFREDRMVLICLFLNYILIINSD